MDAISIKKCVLTLKPKHSEGFNKIPQRILLDEVEILLAPLTLLFSQIYAQKLIPERWCMADTIPISKSKGESHNTENYHPIVILYSTPKIFEKLILKQII